MTAASVSMQPQVSGYAAKRMVDFVAAMIMLVVLSPLLLLIALAIKLTSVGPVFYRQRRLGLGERPFTILKFRSMRVDADKCGPQFTTATDPRITRVGKILRKTSLDELPQLWNVLRGEMSLLGPRPYVGFELENWSAEQRALRASVRPGISGLAQVDGRSSLTAEHAQRCDLDYVRECSFAFDCIILLRTVLAVVRSRGTN